MFITLGIISSCKQVNVCTIAFFIFCHVFYFLFKKNVFAFISFYVMKNSAPFYIPNHYDLSHSSVFNAKIMKCTENSTKKRLVYAEDTFFETLVQITVFTIFQINPYVRLKEYGSYIICVISFILSIVWFLINFTCTYDLKRQNFNIFCYSYLRKLKT